MADDERAPGPAGPPGVPGGASSMPAGPERFRAVLDNLEEVVFETDRKGRWTYLNAAWTRITGRDVEESLGSPFLDDVHPDEREVTIEMFERVVEGRDPYCRHQTRYRTADGSYRWIELRASMLFDENDEYTGNVGTFIDVTDRRRAEEQLEDYTKLLERVACAEPLQEIFGAIVRDLARWTGREVLGETEPWSVGALRGGAGAGGRIAVMARPDSDHLEPVPPAEVLADHSDLDVPIHGIAGGKHLGRFVIRAGVDRSSGDVQPRAVIERSVHLAAIAIGREQVNSAARHRALHDSLTGLPNRTLIADRLQQALNLTSRHGGHVALLLLDLDHFKVINDTFGHGTGDRVLRQVARRVQARLRDSDTVGRLGGDEFAIVLPSVVRSVDAEAVALDIQHALEEPLRLGGVEYHVGGSIGIAVSSAEVRGPADLLRFADVAMYRAKREGTGYTRYDPALDAQQLRGFDLVGQLRHAIDRDELVLHYQPRVALPSGRTVGMESLVRWQHPSRGLIGPDDFVPLAEMTGAARPLLRWVLHRALADSRTWEAQGFKGSVAVNVPAQSLHDPDLPDVIGGLITEDLRMGGRRRLELEITENAIMMDPEGAVAAMARLAELGVTFSIDDFGTGYSSLAYLKALPARALKIDRSFVTHMDADERDARIVRTAVTLAHDLDIDVTAEGVESREVEILLGKLGCDSAQGYHFARPMPAAQVDTWLVTKADATT